jgi:transcriptional regulator with PAS, ATPase and Fis domain
LRVLQEQEVSRVGSEETIPVDVRVIAATNKNLSTMVDQGLFRTDLFYRLNVFPLQIPPLRERKEDIPLLANHFLQEQSRILGKPLEGIAPDSMQLLLDYQWPGNIRELQNVIERSAILTSGSKLVINDSLVSSDVTLNTGASASQSSGNFAPSADDNQYRLADFEKHHILKILEMTGWTIAGKGGAADILDLPAGIHRPK